MWSSRKLLRHTKPFEPPSSPQTPKPQPPPKLWTNYSADSTRTNLTEELSLSSSSSDRDSLVSTPPPPPLSDLDNPLSKMRVKTKEYRCDSTMGDDDDGDTNGEDIPVGTIVTAPVLPLTTSHPNPNHPNDHISSTRLLNLQPHPKPRLVKRVRFGTVRTVSTHTPASEMTPEELGRVHLQVTDYEYFRGTAQFVAAEVRNRCRLEQQQAAVKGGSKDAPVGANAGVGAKGKDLVWENRRCTQPYDAVMERVYHLCATRAVDNHHPKHNSKHNPKHNPTHNSSSTPTETIPPDLFRSLTHWIQIGHSRRGLEKFSLPYLSTARPAARQAAKDAVLIAQEALRKLDESWIHTTPPPTPPPTTTPPTTTTHNHNHNDNPNHTPIEVLVDGTEESPRPGSKTERDRIRSWWRSVMFSKPDPHERRPSTLRTKKTRALWKSSGVEHRYSTPTPSFPTGVTTTTTTTTTGGSVEQQQWLRQQQQWQRQHRRKRQVVLKQLGIPKEFVQKEELMSNETVLKLVSEKYTGSAKLFARVMGMGDAAAVGFDSDHWRTVDT